MIAAASAHNKNSSGLTKKVNGSHRHTRHTSSFIEKENATFSSFLKERGDKNGAENGGVYSGLNAMQQLKVEELK